LGGCFFPSLDSLTDDEGDVDSATSFDAPHDNTTDVINDSDGSTQDAGAKDSGGFKDGGFGFECDGSTVSHCSDCAGAPEACITCDSDGGSYAFCAVAGGTCRNLAPAPFTTSCSCADAGQCHASFQVCQNGSFCHTCGEPMSDGDVCKGGGVCNASTGDCE
jgi:hypothetical protein